jgi:hypothetical protein
MPIKLGELAARFDCELVGDPDITIDNVAGPCKMQAPVR